MCCVLVIRVFLFYICFVIVEFSLCRSKLAVGFRWWLKQLFGAEIQKLFLMQSSDFWIFGLVIFDGYANSYFAWLMDKWFKKLISNEIFRRTNLRFTLPLN